MGGGPDGGPELAPPPSTCRRNERFTPRRSDAILASVGTEKNVTAERQEVKYLIGLPLAQSQADSLGVGGWAEARTAAPN